MKANEIIYAIREKLKEYPDDTRYTDDYIMYLVRMYRALLIRREYSNPQRIVDSEILQTICMPLEEVNSNSCYDASTYYNKECYIMRTIDKVPFTIELHNKNMIYKVGIQNCSTPTNNIIGIPINFISSDRAVYAGSGDFEFNQIFAFTLPDGHLYLKSRTGLHRTVEKINVTAAFDNPDDAAKFTGCNGEDTPCFDILSDRYPIKAWMEGVIISEIVKDLINLKGVPSDEVNNAKADVT